MARKFRQMVSVTKLFAFVEIECFVLGIQIVFTWQMKKSSFGMDWFGANLHKNELLYFTEDGVLELQGELGLCMHCTIQMSFRYQAWTGFWE